MTARRAGAVILLTALVAPAAALEFPPLSREQIACYGNEYAVLVHVVDAHSYSCKRREPGCFPHYVGATAVVDEIIAPSKSGLQIGDSIRVSFSVSQPASFVRPEDLRYDGSIILPDDHADEITDNFAKAGLVGRSFFFAANLQKRSLRGGIPVRLDEPYYAEVYPQEDATWFRTTWASSGCRSEQAKAEEVRKNREQSHNP